MDYNKKLIKLLDDYTYNNGCSGKVDLSSEMFVLPESRLPIRILLGVDGYEVMLKYPVMVVDIQDLTNNESMEVYTELGKMWLKPPPEKSEVDKAKKVLEDAGYLRVYWSKIDVQGRADELGIELTGEQLDDVCEDIVRYHNAEVGINWDVIDYHLWDRADDEQVGDVYEVEI